MRQKKIMVERKFLLCQAYIKKKDIGIDQSDVIR
jgi:hypothetical protein